jgi:transposase
MDIRQQRGDQIASTLPIVQKDGYWIVPSQTGHGRYKVRLDPAPATCECKDYEKRGKPCKHIAAVLAVIEQGESVPPRPHAPVPQPKRPTYKQQWPAYNAAQVNEKAKFQELLFDLCRGLPEPERKPGPGNAPLRPADLIFAAAFKVYSTFSGRRFMTDLRHAHERGYLSRPVHYNSIFNHLGGPALTTMLKALIIESSKPLASVEVDFAGDSTGFTTCRFEPWYDHKYGIVRRNHKWVKVHLMCGVKTNIVTAVEIKDNEAHDGPQLPALVETTARTFAMREVSLDKIYGSLNNYAVIEQAGATPYVPFKSSHTGAGGGLWAKMYHYFNFNRDEFLAHYHKRSNVEATYAMIKAKFGDSVRSKTETAQVNEALCKVLCHNVCCLISAAYELGIAATFWGQDEPEAVEAPGDAGVDEWVEAMAWM